MTFGSTLRSMGFASVGDLVSRVVGHGGTPSGWMYGRAERGVGSPAWASLLRRLVLRGNELGAGARACVECRRVIHWRVGLVGASSGSNPPAAYHRLTGYTRTVVLRRETLCRDGSRGCQASLGG